jgi:hypothetical protein
MPRYCRGKRRSQGNSPSRTTASQTFTITNTGAETLTISGIAIGGSNPGDFTESNNCGGSVTGSAMCTVTVVFQPQAVGQRTATVMVTSNGGSPTVALTGSASNPFSVTPSGPTTATVGPGQPAMCGVSFTPSTTFSGTATFTCTVAPGGPGCTLTPAMVQVTASNNPTPTPVSVVATPTATARFWQLRDFTDSSRRPVALPPAFATAWLLAFFGFASLTWFATRKSWNADAASHRFPIQPRQGRDCHCSNLLDRCLRRFRLNHEAAAKLHGDVHCHERRNQTDCPFHAHGKLGRAHGHVARSECTAKKLPLVKFTG